jgi:hypothetical protein
MKYKVLCGPIQVTADTQAHTGEIIDLPEADGTQLARWGIVEPVADEPEPVAPPEPPAAPATTTAKTTEPADTTTTTAKTTEPADTTTTTAKTTTTPAK